MDLFNFIGVIIIIACIILFFYSLEQKAKKETFSVGKYIMGLPNAVIPKDNIKCEVIENDFVFTTRWAAELGRIPRDSVNQVLVDDKSQISQRLTVTRLLTLGFFALAVPKKKKHKEFCVVIDWDDQEGIRQNTVFEFSGVGSNMLSNYTAEKLKKRMKPKIERLKANEKKCLYCAEIIKTEARICRFCGKQQETIL